MGFNFGSESTPTDSSQNAGDAAKQNRGKGKQLTDNATDLSKSKINTGTSITAAKGSNVVIGSDSGPEVTDLTKTFLDTLTGVANSVSSAGTPAPAAPINISLPSTAGSSDNGTSALNDLVTRSLNQPAVGADAASSGTSIIWLWIGGAVLLVGLGVFALKRRHA